VGRGLHKIGSICKLTGFSPPLLRAWESRHRLLGPKRGRGGQRLYSDDDLRVLLRVRELLGEGRSIGEIAAAGRKTLLAEMGPVPKVAIAESAVRWPLDGSEDPRVVRALNASALAAARITARLDLDQVLKLVAETLAGDFHAALARIWVYDPARNVLHLRASAGLSRRTTGSPRAHLDVATYPYKVGVVARTRAPFLANGLTDDPHFQAEWVERERLQSVAVLPLERGGELYGVLACFLREALSEEILGALGTFAAMTASSIASHRALAWEREAEALASQSQSPR